MKNLALLLIGIGLFLLGLSAAVYVFRGPPKTAEEKYIEALYGDPSQYENTLQEYRKILLEE